MHPHDRLRMIVSTDPDAKHALSYYEVLERFRGLHAREGAAAHRPHAPDPRPPAHVGCPVLADKIYGGRDQLKLSDLVAGPAAEDGRGVDWPAGAARLPAAVPPPANRAVDRGRSPAPRRHAQSARRVADPPAVALACTCRVGQALQSHLPIGGGAASKLAGPTLRPPLTHLRRFFSPSPFSFGPSPRISATAAMMSRNAAAERQVGRSPR